MLLVWPLGDDGPPGTRPLATVALMCVCTGASLWLWSLPADAAEGALRWLGVIPADLTEHGRYGIEPSLRLAPLSSLVLHAGWAHLLINLAYLWLFGRGLEAALGHWRLLLLFVAAGIVGEFAQIVAVPTSPLPMIGASGGIAGILGAYALLFPRANILTLTVFWRTSLVVRVPSLLVIVVWLLTELAFLGPPILDKGGTANFAHLGGFAAGLCLVRLVRIRGLSLLQPARTVPFSSVRRRGVGSKRRLSSET